MVVEVGTDSFGAFVVVVAVIITVVVSKASRQQLRPPAFSHWPSR